MAKLYGRKPKSSKKKKRIVPKQPQETSRLVTDQTAELLEGQPTSPMEQQSLEFDNHKDDICSF
jgi:hypothetical protein